MSEQGLRLALLTEIPAPYRVAAFNALAAHPSIHLDVFFLARLNPKRPYSVEPGALAFDWRVLPGAHVSRGSRWLVVNRGVAAALRGAVPDVVILGGWNQPAFWRAARVARGLRARTVGWIESTLRDDRSGWGPLELAKRRFVHAMDGFVVPGDASRRYLESLDVPPGRIAIAPNAVDTARFAAPAAGRGLLRDRLGARGACILCVGRLDSEKGVDLAIGALAGLPDECGLVVIGVGPERGRLERLAEELAPGRVRFLGFLPPAELAGWYAAADALVLPSRSEQWGMVLNEAAAAGLPLVASEAAGGAWEIVRQGVNGLRVPSGDTAALEAALRAVVYDSGFRERAVALAGEISAAFAPEAWAEAVASLARSVASQ